MAGKEWSEAAAAPPLKSTKMAEQSDVSWRKEVDINLKRLHSLLFGADVALGKGDFHSAQVLALRLVGFLDSRSQSDVDEAFIRPIRREVLAKIDTARRSIVPESDRQSFEQAGRDPGRVFSKQGDIDIENIKQSKYFCALFQKCKGGPLDDPGDHIDRQEKLSCKTSKVLTQAKLTSLYGNISRTNNGSKKSSINSKGSSSEDCIVVEKAHSFHINSRGQATNTLIKLEEEERTHGSSLGSKRMHVEISSPKNEILMSPSGNEEANTDISGNGFVTARAKLEMDVRQRRGLAGSPSSSVSPQSDNNTTNRGYGVKQYGYSRRGIRGNFVPPIRTNGANTGNMTSRIAGKGDDSIDDSTKRCMEMLCGPDGELPEKLRNLEPRLIEHVSNEIMDQDPHVRWDDIAGLEHAKKCVTEMVIWPLLRPDIFKGCRSPGRGLLLFGPPGTGKTMIGKAIAGEAKATFFYISASSLTSKWLFSAFGNFIGSSHLQKVVTRTKIGEGEKLVRALFGVASCRQPAVIFVDEIDSLLSQRKSEGEHESSRRLKTQFLIEMEGFDSGSEQILLIEARAWIIRNLLEKDALFKLSKEETDIICRLTEVNGDWLRMGSYRGGLALKLKVLGRYVKATVAGDFPIEQALLSGIGSDSFSFRRCTSFSQLKELVNREGYPIRAIIYPGFVLNSIFELIGARFLVSRSCSLPPPFVSGYSGSDMKNLVKDASMGPLREALRQGIEITKLRKEDMRPVTLQDFENALQEVRPSVSPNELGTYEGWNRQFGSLSL
ncbi:hypothetical protein RJ639_030060 [Escallonia herrerae]|uniref:AAA+ ATPase domain-containing protein n=1 Tax=Escallonia herrerae TaxID=1293975 RepID=A0AA88WYN0_9ASTE|nr:hypothetical protein RJ639_030060 [Escallonia herrerae]